jgi:hypothetical protein
MSLRVAAPHCGDADRRRYYTGDNINPLVGLQYLAGGMPPNAESENDRDAARYERGQCACVGAARCGRRRRADTIPPRQATLAAIEGRTGKAVVDYTQHSFIFSTISRARDIPSLPACSVIR